MKLTRETIQRYKGIEPKIKSSRPPIFETQADIE